MNLAARMQQEVQACFQAGSLVLAAVAALVATGGGCLCQNAGKVSLIPAPVWRQDAQVVGNPISVDGFVVAETVVEGRPAIVAFATQDGRVKWTNREIGGAIARTTLVSAGGVLLVNTGTGMILGLQPSSGRTLWTVRKDGVGTYQSDLVLDGNSLFYVAGGVLYNFATSSPATIRKVQVIQRPVASGGDGVISLAADKGTLYLVCFRSVIAVDKNTLRRVWTYQAGERTYFGNVKRRPVVFENSLIVAGEAFSTRSSWRFFFLDRQTGKLAWEFLPASGTGNFDPIVVWGGLLHGFKLSSLDLGTRKIRWTVDTGDTFSNLLLAGPTVYVPSVRGVLYGLEPKSGNLWRQITLAARAPIAPGEFTSGVLYSGGYFYFGAKDAETSVYSLYKVASKK